MIKLSDIREIGFQITWKLIDIGFKGGDKPFEQQLTSTEIIDYAIEKMLENDADEDIVNLACEYRTNVSEIDKYIKILAKKENSNYDIELRKWRVAFVLENLPDKKADFTSGLLELSEIWIQLELPDDSPHVFQGRNNVITPEQYYTLNNYHVLLDKHTEWIKSEIEQINAVQDE